MGRRDYGSHVRSVIEEPHPRRLERPSDRRDLSRLDVALLILEADDRAVAHAGSIGRLVDRPLQRCARHAALGRQERFAQQNNPP